MLQLSVWEQESPGMVRQVLFAKGAGLNLVAEKKEMDEQQRELLRAVHWTTGPAAGEGASLAPLTSDRDSSESHANMRAATCT